MKTGISRKLTLTQEEVEVIKDLFESITYELDLEDYADFGDLIYTIAHYQHSSGFGSSEITIEYIDEKAE